MLIAADLTRPPTWQRVSRAPCDLPGGARSLPPAETLARVAPVFDALGVTVVRIDGNEGLGAPIFWACEPEGARAGRDAFEWSYGGKGTTVELARASVVMETIERSYASRLFHPELVRARFEEIAGRAVHPAALGASGPFDPSRVQEWGHGLSLMTGQTRLLHANFLLTPYLPVTGQRLFRADYNGLASGNDTEEAVLHGLYELIERDAWVLAQARPGRLRRIALETARSPDCRRLLDAFERRGAHLVCLELTRDMPGHTLGLVAFDGGMTVRRTSLLVSGTSHDPEVALLRCLTELCQLRANEIFLQEEHPAPTSAAENRRRAGDAIARHGWDASETVGLDQLEARAPATIGARVDALIADLAARGVEVFLSRLASRPGAVEVVKLNAIGLQPITGGITYFADDGLGRFFSPRWTARLETDGRPDVIAS